MTAAAAYRAGVDILDSRTGEHHRYAKRGGIIQSDILALPGSPEWVYDRTKLWNEAEHRADRTTRPDHAQLAREVEISLPHELSHEHRVELVQEFVRDRYVAKGMVADLSFHAPGKGGDVRNHHVHILLTMRPLNDNGEFANANRDWNHKNVLMQDRAAWAEYMNRALERAGHRGDADHRSFVDRQIDRLPTKHLGPDASNMERKGIETRIGDENREATAWNKELLELQEKHDVIILEIEREKRRLAKERKGQKPAPVQDATPLLAQRQTALDLRHLDERRSLEEDIALRRSLLSGTIDRYYDVKRLQEELVQARKDLKKAQTPMGRLSGREQERKDHIKALGLNLRDAERRRAEQLQGFDQKATAELRALGQRQQQETELLRRTPPLEHAAESEDFREYAPEGQAPYSRAVNDNEPDPDYGPSYDR